MGRPKKERFIGDKATNEWLDAQKSGTRNTYQTHWEKFLEFAKMTGDQILADRKVDKERRWEKKVLQFRQWLEDQGQAEYSASCAANVARGFFAFYYLDLKYRRQDIKRLKERTRKTEDYRISREDLAKMAEVGDLTEKYTLLAGKSFGLRAGDFLALTRGDLEPYLDREVPISIGQLGTGKEKVPAYPFIDSDAQPIIVAVIEQMTREGRVASTERILTYKQERELSRIIKRLAEKAGIKFGDKQVRFHCLRKFLTDRISSFMSESKWKQIVGKSIDEKAYVSPEELRRDYLRAMVETTIKRMPDKSDLAKAARKEALLAIARTMGMTEPELKAIFTLADAEAIEKLESWIDTQKQAQAIGGGLPFEVQAAKTVAKILEMAFKEIAKKEEKSS